MEKSKEILKEANILPKLRLDEGQPRRIKFLQDKEVIGTEYLTGKEIPVVAYLVEENGEKKSFRRPKFDKKGELNYLIIRLAEVNEGDEVILEKKHRGLIKYIEVTPVKQTSTVEVDDDNDIPIINENEQENDPTDI